MNIVLVEDSTMIRAQLDALLGDIKSVHIAGHANTEAEAIALIEAVQPDLILMNVWDDRGTCVNVLRAIRAAGNSTRAVMVMNQCDEHLRRVTMELGAHGYFDKSTQLEQLVASIVDWLFKFSVPRRKPEFDLSVYARLHFC